MTMSSNRHKPIFDIHPVTGVGIEVFYADRSLETFGKGGSGWFWWFRHAAFRRRGNLQVRSLRATPHIGTPWGLVWGLRGAA